MTARAPATDRPSITALATMFPTGRASVHPNMDDEPLDRSVLEVPKLRAINLAEVREVPVGAVESVGERATAVARSALARADVDVDGLDLIVDFSTVGREANGLSVGYRVQGELGARGALVLAIGNGSCSGFQLALRTAAAFMAGEPDCRRALLVSSDVVVGRRYHAPLGVFGDGASAAVLERGRSGATVLGTAIASRGQLHRVLGVRHDAPDNFDLAAFENYVVPVHYRATRRLAADLLGEHGLTPAELGLVLTQNMSRNDAAGLAATLEIPVDRVFTSLAGHGHVFGSDLVINLEQAGRAGALELGAHVLLASSGAGFGWGLSLLRITDTIGGAT